MLTRINNGTPRKHIHVTTIDDMDGPLTLAQRQDSQGNEPIGALVSCDTDDVRITFDGTAPSQTNSIGHILGPSRGPIYLRCLKSIKNLRWVSAAATTPGEIQITLFY